MLVSSLLSSVCRAAGIHPRCLPTDWQAEHKIQSADGPLTLTLERVGARAWYRA